MQNIQTHPFKKLIETIDQFKNATRFFEWFAGDALVKKIISEELNSRIFERISEYYLHGRRVATAGGKFEMSALYEGCYHAIMRTREQVYNLVASFQDLDTKFVAQIALENSYTRLSQHFYKDHYCGRSWVIFELPILFEMYENLSLEKRLFNN